MIVCGWTRYPAPETLKAISKWPFTLAYVGGSETDYFDLLSHWWPSPEQEIVTVEHDIVPSPELIQEMLDCPRSWCAALYPFEQRALFGLGLTKFSLTIRRSLPNLFELIAPIANDKHPARHWCLIDANMQNALNSHSGHTCHVHEGQIEHRNPIRSHVECRLSPS